MAAPVANEATQVRASFFGFKITLNKQNVSVFETLGLGRAGNATSSGALWKKKSKLSLRPIHISAPMATHVSADVVTNLLETSVAVGSAPPTPITVTPVDAETRRLVLPGQMVTSPEPFLPQQNVISGVLGSIRNTVASFATNLFTPNDDDDEPEMEISGPISSTVTDKVVDLKIKPIQGTVAPQYTIATNAEIKADLAAANAGTSPPPTGLTITTQGVYMPSSAEATVVNSAVNSTRSLPNTPTVPVSPAHSFGEVDPGAAAGFQELADLRQGLEAHKTKEAAKGSSDPDALARAEAIVGLQFAECYRLAGTTAPDTHAQSASPTVSAPLRERNVTPHTIRRKPVAYTEEEKENLAPRARASAPPLPLRAEGDIFTEPHSAPPTRARFSDAPRAPYMPMAGPDHPYRSDPKLAYPSTHYNSFGGATSAPGRTPPDWPSQAAGEPQPAHELPVRQSSKKSLRQSSKNSLRQPAAQSQRGREAQPIDEPTAAHEAQPAQEPLVPTLDAPTSSPLTPARQPTILARDFLTETAPHIPVNSAATTPSTNRSVRFSPSCDTLRAQHQRAPAAVSHDDVPASCGSWRGRGSGRGVFSKLRRGRAVAH